MPSLNTTYAESFARVRAGEQGGDTLSLNRYVQRLVALAGRKLHAKIKGEAEDVVQSAMLSFAARHKDEVDLQAEDGLWDVLVEITLRHCDKWNKRSARQRTGTVPLQPSRDDADAALEPADDEPTPEEAAILAELLERLMRSCKTKSHRDVLTRRLQGCAPLEISRELRLSERSVYRALEDARRHLRDRLETLRVAP